MKQLTKDQQNIVAGGIMAVTMFLLLIWKVYIPMGKEINKKEDELSGLNQKISVMKNKARQHEKLEREAQLLRLEVQETQKQLPPTAEIDDLLRHITDSAQKIGIFVQSFGPGPKAVKNYYTEIPVTLQIKCTYHSLAKFLIELAHSERIISAQNIRFTPGSIQEGYSVNASLTLLTYMSK